MRAAQIINGLVANILEVNSYNVIPGLIDAQNANIGDGWDGAKFVKPVPPALPIPISVSRYQALAALSKAGLLVNAQNAAAASPNPLVALAFNNAQTFDRASPTVATLAGALGLTSAQLDQLFITAATLTA